LVDLLRPLLNIPRKCEQFFGSESDGIQTWLAKVVRSLDNRPYRDRLETTSFDRENRGNNTTMNNGWHTTLRTALDVLMLAWWIGAVKLGNIMAGEVPRFDFLTWPPVNMA
jgi:hypothetical protein